jgi:hypothetical protein
MEKNVIENNEIFKYILFLIFILTCTYLLYLRDNKLKDFNKKSWYGKLLAFRMYLLLFLGFAISIYLIIRDLIIRITN